MSVRKILNVQALTLRELEIYSNVVKMAAICVACRPFLHRHHQNPESVHLVTLDQKATKVPSVVKVERGHLETVENQDPQVLLEIRETKVKLALPDLRVHQDLSLISE